MVGDAGREQSLPGVRGAVVDEEVRRALADEGKVQGARRQPDARPEEQDVGDADSDVRLLDRACVVVQMVGEAEHGVAAPVVPGSDP